MTYAIVTRYHGPTNYRGSRIIGTGPSITSDGPKTRATVPYDYATDSGEAQHRRAADAVAEKLRGAGWNVITGPGAMLPDERGYVFVLRYDPQEIDARAVLERAMIGPTNGETARRLAGPTAENLDAAGYRITR
jgi:hypothetical protein